MRKINNSENLLVKIMESVGFNLEKISETDTESPDFILKANDSTYLIELKTKSDDSSIFKKKEKILKLGRVFEQSTSISSQKTVAKRVKKASSQLTSLDIAADYRIVWIFAFGAKPDVQVEQIEMTLYGSANLMNFAENSGLMKPCFFFDESSFFRYKNSLDAAVIATANKGKLCLNNYSPRYTAFKESTFYKAFKDGVLDPLEEEANGLAYIMDGDLDRADEKLVMKYVKQKYGKQELCKLNFTHFSASIDPNKIKKS